MVFQKGKLVGGIAGQKWKSEETYLETSSDTMIHETSCFQLRPKIGDEGDKILARPCFILKFLKSEANFDAERGILAQKC